VSLTEGVKDLVRKDFLAGKITEEEYELVAKKADAIADKTQ